MELKALAALVDHYYAVREERLAADRHAARLKEGETDLQKQILDAMGEGHVGSVGGTLCRVTRQGKQVPIAQDWGLLYKFIVANDACDLLQKRLHEAACKQRYEDGIHIPGVDLIEVPHLSVSKL